MKILIISGSPRKGGNTELLAEAFAKGASKHHQVEIVSVRDYKVNPCLGCNACFTTNGTCAQKDDMAIIYEKMMVSTNQYETYARSSFSLLTLLRETGMASWLWRITSCMARELEEICSTWPRLTIKARWQRTIMG